MSGESDAREGQLKDDGGSLPDADFYDELDDLDDLEMLDLSFSDVNEVDEDFSYDEYLYDLDPPMNGQMDPKGTYVDSGNEIPSPPVAEYILGTLVVRVVAARGLKPGRKLKSQSRRRIFQRVPSCTFANASFGNQVQRTSSVEETSNPSWARKQSLFFDVTLSVPHLTQDHGSTEKQIKTSNYSSIPNPPPPKPILMLSIFHSENDLGSSNGKGNKPTKKPNISSEQDELVGIASIDVTSVITGKTSCIDRWLPVGGLDDASGTVRVIIEYDCAESQPRIGDKVKFTGFIDPTLCPVPKAQIYRVNDVIGDEVILSYTTPIEHWKCTFVAHRFMLISVERHVTAVERYHDEIIEFSSKLANSPAAEVISETMKSLPQEGILFVGMHLAFGSLALADRWINKGLGTAVDDIVYSINLDGQHTPHDDMDDEQSINGSEFEGSIASLNDEDSSLGTDANDSIASGMPCCPISGQPMRKPVVAADGHTYDRSSIRKWLRRSDISPLTGTVLRHKELVPNYLLISSFQSSTEESSQVSQF